MNPDSPDWELYERMIARLVADQLSTDYCVTPNARIAGVISGRSRQLDVLIDARHDTDNSRRIIIDAKKRKRKIDVTDVEAFRGLMADVNATHGYLVCPSGHTKAAELRAQTAVSIRLVPFDRLKDFDPSSWPRCTYESCEGGRIFWDGYPELSMNLRPLSGPPNTEPIHHAFIYYVGKCDQCRRFYVQCQTCGDLLSPPHDDESDTGHWCGCSQHWLWLASIEADEHGQRSAELHVALRTGHVITVDRRSL